MTFKSAITLIFVFTIIATLFIYYPATIEENKFMPIKNEEPELAQSFAESLQFFPNMRYQDSIISYKIEGCSIKKSDDMRRALQRVASKTVLSFYPVEENPEIEISCADTGRFEAGLFIAGEGGPRNITKIGDYNLITKGEILLLRDSKCPEPNVATHELLHALGFDHVLNPENIMYNISNCEQDIFNSTILRINEIYSVPGNPDLYFENVSANQSGKYLSLNIDIRNNGFKDSYESKIIILLNNELVKEIILPPLEFGAGKRIKLTNLLIGKANIDELKLTIDSDFEELDKSNNEITLIPN